MRNFLSHITFMSFLLVVIFILRSHFITLSEASSVGFLHFKTFINPNFILGLFGNASHFFRVVLISVSLGIISLIYMCLYSFLSHELKLLRWGMTILLTGILGNGLEKLFFNFVTDYAYLDLGPLEKYIFNLSDFLQILGLIILIKEIFSKQEIIWFPNLRRQKLIIYKDIQISIALKVLGIVMIGNLTQLALTITLLFAHLKDDTQSLQLQYIASFIVLNLALLPLLAYFLIKELLKCIGPVYALERHLKNAELDGKSLKLRKSDYFSSMEDAFNKFISRNFKD